MSTQHVLRLPQARDGSFSLRHLTGLRELTLAHSFVSTPEGVAMLLGDAAKLSELTSLQVRAGPLPVSTLR